MADATAPTATTSPDCPDCGSPMRRVPVRNGPRAGLEMWSCRRFPDCKGAINIDPVGGGDGPTVSSYDALPAAYAQRRHERELERVRIKRRALLPLFVAVAILAMGLAISGLQQFGLPVASLGAAILGTVVMVGMFRLPIDSLVWTKGIEGERRTAGYLEPLLDRGYIALYNRLIPGFGGDVDCILIGPTGVFAIETKNWTGTLQVRNDRLFIGESDRSWAIDQLYKEAIAVQIALASELNEARVTVVPILCAVRGVKAGPLARGIRVTNGKDLAEFIAARPVVFGPDAVRSLARLAERNLRSQYAWEAVPSA